MCIGHAAGTRFGLGPNSLVMLGMPKGFNKVGDPVSALRLQQSQDKAPLCPLVRLWEKGNKPNWDHLNIPVWALVENGYLFVRTYCPRINIGFVDVIEDGSITMVPNAYNVALFSDEID